LLRKNPAKIIKGTSSGDEIAVAIWAFGAKVDRNVPNEDAVSATINTTTTQSINSVPPGYKFVIQ
jgi:hypothetical protein